MRYVLFLFISSGFLDFLVAVDTSYTKEVIKRFMNWIITSNKGSTTNLMKACLCLYVDKIWFKVVYMLYYSENEQLYCINQKTQYLNNISTTFTTIF